MLLVNGSTTPHSIEEKDRENKWYRLTFDLGMRGLTPIPSAIENIRIEENVVNITTEFYRMIKIHFEDLHIFDMELVGGISAQEKVNDYVVYDWFDIKRGAKQASCKILTPNNFIKKLVFYPSQRRDGNDGSIKDCYVKSYIAADDLDKFEYSETAARLGVLKLIKDNGIKTTRKVTTGGRQNLNLVLKHNRRELHKNNKEFIQSDDLPSNTHFCNISQQWN